MLDALESPEVGSAMNKCWLVVMIAAAFVGSLPASATQGRATLCFGQRPTISGTPGNDTIRGTSRNDVIVGGAGNDTIRGVKGDDLICGGEGSDELQGDNGRDRLAGWKGNDIPRFAFITLSFLIKEAKALIVIYSNLFIKLNRLSESLIFSFFSMFNCVNILLNTDDNNGIIFLFLFFSLKSL